MEEVKRTGSRLSRRAVLMGGVVAAGAAAAVGYHQMGKPRTASDRDKDDTLAPGFHPLPFWWDELGPTPIQDSEWLDSVDFLVVGAGYSGLSAARTLAENGAKVLVLDAERPFFGASSRNAGFFGQAYESHVDVSAPGGRARYDEFLASNDYLRKLMIDDKIDAGVRYGRFRAASHASDFDDLKKEALATRNAYKFDYEVVEPPQSRHFIKSPMAINGGIFLPNAPFLQPARLAHGNYLGALGKGAHVVSKTRVMDVVRDTDGRFIAKTTRGTVRARGVLLAVGGIGARAFSAMDNVLQLKGYQVTTLPLTPEQIASVWDKPIAVMNTKRNFDIIIPSPDGKRLIIGGGLTGNRYNSTTDMAVELCQHARKIFPQLGRFQVANAWEGIIATTSDSQKHLFRDEEGVYYLTGDNGSGVGKMHWLGHKAALRMMSLPGSETTLALDAPPPSFPLGMDGNDWFMPGVTAGMNIMDDYNL
jgi:glycine/D-amino acid oxidase-like deaminating enzyme